VSLETGKTLERPSAFRQIEPHGCGQGFASRRSGDCVFFWRSFPLATGLDHYGSHCFARKTLETRSSVPDSRGRESRYERI